MSKFTENRMRLFFVIFIHCGKCADVYYADSLTSLALISLLIGSSKLKTKHGNWVTLYFIGEDGRTTAKLFEMWGGGWESFSLKGPPNPHSSLTREECEWWPLLPSNFDSQERRRRRGTGGTPSNFLLNWTAAFLFY